jgi:hypothetical protein
MSSRSNVDIESPELCSLQDVEQAMIVLVSSDCLLSFSCTGREALSFGPCISVIRPKIETTNHSFGPSKPISRLRNEA